jgi:phosphomannomutase/phosphoglucomutase
VSNETINPHIFRAYDIRGHAERDLSDAVVARVARAYGTYLRRREKRRIALCRDCRLSSDRIHAVLLDGLLASGLDVLDIGVGPTPLLYFATHHFALDGGIQITGSHNPAPDNGLKPLCARQSLAGDDIQELRRIAEQSDFVTSARGRIEALDAAPAYVGYLRGNLQLSRTDLRFAVDAGNGAGGPLALRVMGALGLAPDPLFCDMDGRFPNHHPDPTDPHTLTSLVARVREKNHEFGIAYDGDADRLGVVDAHGDILWGDRLMILLARSILERHPGAAILGEVKCSQTLYDDIAAHGGRAIIWKTGHSLIKQKMKDEHALLAGEMSGHLFYADRYYGYDDAIYASLRLLEILADEERSLSELLAELPRTFVTPEIRFDCPDDRKFDVVRRVLDHYRHGDVLDIDGARIRFPGGWGLVRASNTQPALVMRFEADSPERLAQLRTEVEGVVARSA